MESAAIYTNFFGNLRSFNAIPVCPISNANKAGEALISNGGLVIPELFPNCNCTKSFIGIASSVYGNDVTELSATLNKYNDGLFLKKSLWTVGVKVLSMILNDMFLKLFHCVLFSVTPGHSSNWYQNTVDCEPDAGMYFNLGDSKVYNTSRLSVHSNTFSSILSTLDVLKAKLIKALKHLKLGGNVFVKSMCYNEIHIADSLENSANQYRMFCSSASV